MNPLETGEEFIAKTVLGSSVHAEVLRLARRHDSRLWLGGGAIRNLVWGAITGRHSRLEDFDLVYFDSDKLDQLEDRRLERNIRMSFSRVVSVSVRNQARMHIENGEPKRHSLYDAIANWPETATAIAVRLNATGTLEFIAPHGFGDLLNMVVRPTEFHLRNPHAFERRRMAKRWNAVWPELEYFVQGGSLDSLSADVKRA